MAEKRSPNGTLKPYQMKDGRYGIAASLGKDETGKRLRHVETGKSEQEVIEKMHRWLSANGYMGEETLVINGQSTIEELVIAFKKKSLMGTVSDVTYENYGYALKYVQDYFCGKKLCMIDKDEMKRFFTQMSKATKDGEYKYSQCTLDRTRYISNRMFAWAVEKGYLTSNPVDDKKIKTIKSNKVTEDVTAIQKDELEKLMEVLKKHETVYPVINFMLHTGVRTQEALGLQWGDIDFENNTVFIHRAMTKKTEWDSQGQKIRSYYEAGPTKNQDSIREISVPIGLIDYLREWREKAPKVSRTKVGEKDFVFGNSKEPYWTCDGFRSSVNRCLNPKKKEGENEQDTEGMSLRLHRIRHTVATLLSNEPEATAFHIMQLLGHSDTRMSQKYIDRDTELRKKMNQKMLGHISKGFNF